MSQGEGLPARDGRWQKGQSGNPRGLSREQSQLIMANARMAVLVRRRILSGLIRKMREDPDWAPPITSDVLKLLKESEDRGLGAAIRHVSVSGDARVFRLDPTQMSTRALEEVMSIIDGRGRSEVEDDGESVMVEGPDGRVVEVLAEDDYRGDELDLDDPELL